MSQVGLDFVTNINLCLAYYINIYSCEKAYLKAYFTPSHSNTYKPIINKGIKYTNMSATKLQNN